MRTFRADVTPPVGDYLCGGLHGRSIGIDRPIWLSGIILEANGTRYVIASIEYCYLVGRSHNRMIDTIAHATGVPASQVTVHSTHAHDAPLINEELHALLEPIAPGVHNESYFQRVLNDARQSVSEVLRQPGTVVGGVAYSTQPVKEFASNRRVVGADGTIGVRWSICRDLQVRNAPVGTIDPLLRQVIFYDKDEKPVAAISNYTSHPQVSDGRGLIGGEAPGYALQMFRQAYPDVFHMYLTGCAGDITAGKFTTLNKERNLLLFGSRLFDAMDSAFLHATPRPLGSVRWFDSSFDLQLSQLPTDIGPYRKIMLTPADSPTAAVGNQYVAGLRVLRLQNHIKQYRFRLSRLSLGGIDLLFAPAELLLKYQRFAQSQSPGELVMSAYGDSFLNYVAPAECFTEGGYEVDPNWTEVDESAEASINRAISEILRR